MTSKVFYPRKRKPMPKKHEDPNIKRKRKALLKRAIERSPHKKLQDDIKKRKEAKDERPD